MTLRLDMWERLYRNISNFAVNSVSSTFPSSWLFSTEKSCFETKQIRRGMRRLEVHKDLGGDRTRTANPKGPGGYPAAYSIKLNNKTGRVSCGAAATRELTGHQSVGWWAIVLCITHFVYSIITIIIIVVIIPSFSVLLNCLYLNPWVFPNTTGGANKQTAVWCW